MMHIIIKCNTEYINDFKKSNTFWLWVILFLNEMKVVLY